VLRVAGADPGAQELAMSALQAAAPRLQSPLLLTLCGHLSTRRAPAAVRLFWPKDQVAKGASRPDARAPWRRR
jgi:hypothetical protein